MPTKALIIGVSYDGELNCHEDASNVIDMVRNFDDSCDIKALFDHPEYAERYADAEPTKDNIIEYMGWLADSAQDGDRLFFFFAGHGSQKNDDDGVEKDGFDECIVSSDYIFISDDIIHNTMIKHLPFGVCLTAMFDSCRAGTILDLPYEYNGEELVPAETRATGGSEANVVLISACKEAEDAMEGGSLSSGLFTAAFITAIRCSENISFRELFNFIRQHVKEREEGQNVRMTCNLEDFNLDDQFTF